MKKLFILTVVGLMVCLIGFVDIASAWDHDHGKDKMGKTKTRHLYLYQKCPQEPNVDFCIPDVFPIPPLHDQYLDRVHHGAWGKMEYKSEGAIFKFEFEGRGLKPLEPGDRSYTLIYYPENWSSGMGLIYLGSDIADKHGNVHIKGSLDTGNLPAPYDYNFYPDYTAPDPTGAKIWLVLSSDICIRRDSSPPKMIGWHPDKYLFEEDLITFTDTDFDPNYDCVYM